MVESNFGDGMFTELFKKVLGRIYPCPIEEVRQHVQKELRIIDTLEPIMNQHRLIVDRKIIERDYREFANEKDHHFRLFYQMTRMNKEKGALVHDDGIDCLAMAVQYWIDQMSLDQDEQDKLYNDEKKQQQYEDFLENHSLNHNPTKNSWIH